MCKKIKRTILMLATLVMLCGLAGCDSSETSSGDSDDLTSTSQSISAAESNKPQDLEISSDITVSSDTQSKQSDSQSEFDFDEVVKNITLFGSKISLPCTIKEFGKDFSLDDPSKMMLIESSHAVSSDLLYKGKTIGTLVLADCGENDVFEEKQIDYLSLGFLIDTGHWNDEIRKLSFDAYGWYTEPIEFNLAGISFDTSAKDVIAKLGKPTEDSEKENFDGTLIRKITYDYPNGGMLRFSFADGKMYHVYIICGNLT